MSTLSEKVNADFMAIFEDSEPRFKVAEYRVKYTHWDGTEEVFLVETPYQVSTRDMSDAVAKSIGFYNAPVRGKSLRLVTYR